MAKSKGIVLALTVKLVPPVGYKPIYYRGIVGGINESECEAEVFKMMKYAVKDQKVEFQIVILKKKRLHSDFLLIKNLPQ